MVRVKNFLSIFAKNGQSNLLLVLVLVLVLESKGPYCATLPTNVFDHLAWRVSRSRITKRRTSWLRVVIGTADWCPQRKKANSFPTVVSSVVGKIGILSLTPEPRFWFVLFTNPKPTTPTYSHHPCRPPVHQTRTKHSLNVTLDPKDINTSEQILCNSWMSATTSLTPTSKAAKAQKASSKPQ